MKQVGKYILKDGKILPVTVSDLAYWFISDNNEYYLLFNSRKDALEYQQFVSKVSLINIFEENIYVKEHVSKSILETYLISSSLTSKINKNNANHFNELIDITYNGRPFKAKITIERRMSAIYSDNSGLSRFKYGKLYLIVYLQNPYSQFNSIEDDK